jgi:hypothetical protein
VAGFKPPRFSEKQKAKLRDPKWVIALQAAKPLVRQSRRAREKRGKGV